jgi:hypothetical protein
MAPYFKKHQCLDPGPRDSDEKFMPTGRIISTAHQHLIDVDLSCCCSGMKAKYHGTDGPIHTSFNDFYQVRPS